MTVVLWALENERSTLARNVGNKTFSSAVSRPKKLTTLPFSLRHKKAFMPQKFTQSNSK